MDRKVPWAWVLMGSVGVLVLLWVVMLGTMSSLFGASGAVAPVALISLQGAISDTESSSLLSGRSGGTRGFIWALERAVRDPEVKAVVIRINSPGGSAAASQEMYQAVMRARKSKKIYASMGGVAASGGYYIASACDKIFALPSTLTGSIGVISQFLSYGDLMRKLGLDQAVIKSGKFKDSGNPARRLTPEEKVLFQAINRDIYEQFVDDVVAGRSEATHGGLTKDKLLPLADGRVFTGRQALAVELVDEMGGLHEAVQEAGREAGVRGEVQARDIEQPGGLLSGLVGASAQGAASQAGQAFGSSLGHSFGAGVADEVQARLQSSAAPPRLQSPLQLR